MFISFFLLILSSYSFYLSQIKPSFGVTAMDVLKFCAESNPHVYIEKAAQMAYVDGEEEEDHEQGMLGYC